MAAAGNLYLTESTINLNAQFTSGGTLIDPSRVIGTATQVNVLSNTASVQQAIDIASPTNPVTVQVSPGQYPGDLTISNAQVTLVCTNGDTLITATNVIIGLDSSAATSGVTIYGSTLYVTNALATGVLDVRNGTLTFSGVMATVDNLLLTNGTLSTMIFSNGTLQVGSAAVTNGQQFVVGDGADSATYRLLGGAHSFNNGLRIRNNATLSGCGSINGVVLVDAGGTVAANCGGTLTFTGSVTNNGIMYAENGSVLESYGPVVNNGIIDIMDGSTNFHSTFVNNGTVVDTSPGTPVFYRASNISLKISFSNILASCSDPAGNAITLTGISPVTTNGVTLVTNSTYIFYLNTNNVTDAFNYTISDGYGGTATGTVLIEMTQMTGSLSLVSLQTGYPGPGTNTLTFAGIPNYQYIVQFATNLTTSPWFTLSTNTAAATGLWSVMDPTATNAQRYYRLAMP